MALTYAGAKLYIGTTAANADLDLSGFQAKSYTRVNSTGSVGDWETTDNILTYNTTDDDVADKQKGVANAGDPAIECAYSSSDTGQLAMVTARDASDKYPFKLELSNGDILYSRGVVGGAGIGGGGGREDFVVRKFSLGLVQIPVWDV